MHQAVIRLANTCERVADGLDFIIRAPLGHDIVPHARAVIKDLIDLVDQFDGDPDLEPSLGSMGEQHINQEVWARGDRRDLEQDDGETGIADQDGLDEQVPFRDWQHVGMV